MKKLLFVFLCLISFTGFSQILKETGDEKTDQAYILSNQSRLSLISYDELATYTEPFTKFVLKNCDAKTKSRLWKERINFFTQTEKLSSAQTTALKELAALTVPTFFESATGKKQVEGWITTNMKLFGKETLTVIGTQMKKKIPLPTPNPSNPSPSPTTLSCNCSQTSDFCWGSSYCKTWSCNLVGDACGWFWSYDCNGRCYTPNN
jgi:hypothetical protein